MPRTVFNKYIHTLEALEKAEKEHGATNAGQVFDITYMSFTRWKKKALSFKYNEFTRIEDLPEKNYFVYVIKTDINCYYVGCSEDMNLRLTTHENNIKRFDGSYLYEDDDYPLTVVHIEGIDTEEEAKNRELDWILYFWHNIDHSKLKNERIKGKPNNIQRKPKEEPKPKTDSPRTRKPKKEVEPIRVTKIIKMAEKDFEKDEYNAGLKSFIDRGKGRDLWMLRIYNDYVNQIIEGKNERIN